MIKEEKSALINVLNNAGFTNVDVVSKLFPKNEKDVQEIELEANKANPTIFVCYAGRDWGDTRKRRVKTAHANSRDKSGINTPAITFALLIFSKYIDTENDPADIEILVDSIADELYKKGYTLLSDDPTPVPSMRNGLYEITLYVEKEIRYFGP